MSDNFKQMRLFAIFLCVCSLSYGQIGTDEWRIHSQSKNAIDVASSGNILYTAFEAAILEYDLEYNELSKLDVTNGLSDIQITNLGMHEPSGSVFVGYANGNIDQIQGTQITNIPGIKLATISGMKTIHSFKSHGSYIYAATGFGVVKIDPSKSEIKDTYYPGGSSEEIIEIMFNGDSIYALTNTRLYKGSLSNPALADSSQWVVESKLPIITDNQFYYKDVEFWNDSIYYLKNYTSWGGDSVFVVRSSGSFPIIDLHTDGELSTLQIVASKLMLSGFGVVVGFNSDLTQSYYTQFYDNNLFVWPNSITFFKNEYWFADSRVGLMRGRNGGYENIPFDGPARSQFFKMDWEDGILAVVPGAYDDHANYNQPGILFFEDEKWSGIQKEEDVKWNNNRSWDFIAVSINPKNTNQMAVGGVCYGPSPLLTNQTTR